MIAKEGDMMTYPMERRIIDEETGKEIGRKTRNEKEGKEMMKEIRKGQEREIEIMTKRKDGKRKAEKEIKIQKDQKIEKDGRIGTMMTKNAIGIGERVTRKKPKMAVDMKDEKDTVKERKVKRGMVIGKGGKKRAAGKETGNEEKNRKREEKQTGMKDVKIEIPAGREGRIENGKEKLETPVQTQEERKNE